MARRSSRPTERGFTLLEVLIAMAIFAMGSIVLIASYINVLNSYHAASQGLQGDQELAFCRNELMQITDLTLAETGDEYDAPQLDPNVPPTHVKWTATITPTTGVDVFAVVLTVTESVGGDAKTINDTFTMLRPTWSDPTDKTALRQTNQAAILTMQGRQAK
jgi:general secretion pathway protein I